MSAPVLRTWLARQPHPATVRGEKPDGEEKTVTLGVARSKFRDAAECLKECIRCVALDEKGNELRVWEVENAEELRGAKAEEKGDPLSNSVERIAAIIADSCDRAVQRHAEMVRTGFEQMAEFVRAATTRNSALEKAYLQMVFNAQQTQPETDPNAAMVNTLLPLLLGGGLMQSPQQPQPPNGSKKDA